MQGAKADGYVTDIMTISGGSSSIKNQYIEQGWTVTGFDLNSRAGGDYVYLLYKTNNETGSSGNYITDFYIKKLSDPDQSSHPNFLKYEGRTYYLTPGGGNDDFNSHGCDLNHGVGGDYLYLYYTKDAFSTARAINRITFQPIRSESASIIDNAKKGAVGANGEGEGCDLNSKAYHNNITMNCKIFMHINVVEPITGIATGLHQVTSDKSQVQSEEWYTLDGRKLRGMPTQRGIYVSNGKRIIIK